MQFLNAMVNGGGAITQQMVHAKLTEALGNVDEKMVSGVEWIVAALAAGSIDQPQLNAYLNGFSGGSAKDLLTGLLSKFGVSSKLSSVVKSDTTTPAITTSSGKYLI